MIWTTIVLIRANPSVYLKVPELFCLYRDNEKLPTNEVLSSDVPYFFEIQYTEDELPKSRFAYSIHGFDYSKKKFLLNHQNRYKVPRESLKTEYLLKKRRNIEALLLPFTGILAFHYSMVQGWFIELNHSSVEGIRNHYGQLGYFYQDPLEEKETLSSIEVEQYFVGNPVVLLVRDTLSNRVWDIKLSDMFAAFNAAPPPLRKVVLSAARQYHKSESLSHIDPVAKFLYQVYAIETLINHEYQDIENPLCEFCGQRKFSVRQKFHSFIQKYSDSYEKKAVDQIYELRSAIVHTGKVLFESGFFLFEDDLDERKREYFDERTLELTSSIVKSTINKFLFLNSPYSQTYVR